MEDVWFSVVKTDCKNSGVMEEGSFCDHEKYGTRLKKIYWGELEFEWVGLRAFSKTAVVVRSRSLVMSS